jgi:UDP-N-acetylglucosamine 2-epimerase (non-hydrolysing)
MLKVMTIVGTRPEIIKLSRVIAQLDKHTEHILVHTGQNYDYELNQIFFDEMEIRRPDFFLEAAGENAAKSIANVISKSDDLFENVRPDALLIYGDTNSCLCVIPAKRRKIPIFHMEAGNRCFDARVPEEANRKIVDHLSDINMPLTEHARRYLIAEGLKPETVIKTGSCMKEVLEYYGAKIDRSNIISQIGLKSRNYFVVSIHREENLDLEENFGKLPSMLNALADKYAIPIIFSTHPRTMKKLEELSYGALSPLVRIHKPFGFFDYIMLQKEAFCVLSDSGTITEEASLLGISAVTLRLAHERPEGMDEGTLIMSVIDKEFVLDAVDLAVSDSLITAMRIPDDYDVANVSNKVVKIIYSYTDYVNRTVWKK